MPSSGEHLRMKYPPLFVGLLTIAFACFARPWVGAAQSSSQDATAEHSSLVRIADMRIDGVVEPLGIEEAAPRFSWLYKAEPDAPRGFSQASYQIQVATSQAKLREGQGDMWDSGKCPGNDTISVIYAGKPLAAMTRYYWRVTGYDDAGRAYPSAPQFFEMGLLTASDWQGAEWIGARKERLITFPGNLQRLADYTFETRFSILEGSASVLFRAPYAWNNHYGIEIYPGHPGKLVVYRNPDGGKPQTLKEYTLKQGIELNSWHALQVTLSGDKFSFRVDGIPVHEEPRPDVEKYPGSAPSPRVTDVSLSDGSYKNGSVALGSLTKDGTRGLARFDDFRLTVDGETLVNEKFDDTVTFAFQEVFYSPNVYSLAEKGCLETRGMHAYLEPKSDQAAPYLRKSFQKKQGKILRARAYVSGLGYYTFWMNGKRMDDYLLHPGNTRYNKTAYYTVYDITDSIALENVLAFELGRGWYAMTTPTLWGETYSNDWMAEPTLRTLVTLDYEDGTRQTIVSNPSFKTAPGPILFDSVKAGEIYDARRERQGWNTTSFDDKDWSPAVVSSGRMPSAGPGLRAEMFEPIREIESFPAVSIEKIEGEQNAWLVDFGKHLAGNVEIKVAGPAGHQIRLNYFERTDQKHIGRERWNNFDAQRTGSYQRDIYILKGKGVETYQARYSYKGFRYLRVEGLPEAPTLDQFTAKAINSDMRKAGVFKSSSDLWNKIWEAGRRSIQGNMHSIPTDCPSFEKLGWTCDDSAPFYAMIHNYDLRQLYEKRLQDFADDISPDGHLSNVIPSTWGRGEDPAWVGSYVQIAWKHYQTYGDLRLVSRHYDNLKLYMETLIQEGRASEKPPLLTKPRVGFGDWVSPGGDNVPPEGALIYYDCFYYRYLGMMEDLAGILGKQDDVAYYSGLRKDLKQAFNEFFFDEVEGVYHSTNRNVGFRQSPQIIPLAFGLVPDKEIPRLTERLVRDIHEKKDHFWTGILGLEFIADVLCENGQADLAYAMHLKDDYPSLGNMIRQGATTLWEAYSFETTRSLNHKMFATPLGWMARYVTGLRSPDNLSEGNGFRQAVIEPYPSPTQLEYAQLDYESPMGTYRSGWRVIGGGMVYNIEVPPNATAVFRLPLFGKTNVSVSESGTVLWQNENNRQTVKGVTVGALMNDRLAFTLGSGKYAFMVKDEAVSGSAQSR